MPRTDLIVELKAIDQPEGKKQTLHRGLIARKVLLDFDLNDPHRRLAHIHHFMGDLGVTPADIA